MGRNWRQSDARMATLFVVIVPIEQDWLGLGLSCTFLAGFWVIHSFELCAMCALATSVPFWTMMDLSGIRHVYAYLLCWGDMFFPSPLLVPHPPHTRTLTFFEHSET